MNYLACCDRLAAGIEVGSEPPRIDAGVVVVDVRIGRAQGNPDPELQRFLGTSFRRRRNKTLANSPLFFVVLTHSHTCCISIYYALTATAHTLTSIAVTHSVLSRYFARSREKEFGSYDFWRP